MFLTKFTDDMGRSLRSISEVMRVYSTTLQSLSHDVLVLKNLFPLSSLSKKVDTLFSSFSSFHRASNDRNEIFMSLFDQIMCQFKKLLEHREQQEKEQKSNLKQIYDQLKRILFQHPNPVPPLKIN